MKRQNSQGNLPLIHPCQSAPINRRRPLPSHLAMRKPSQATLDRVASLAAWPARPAGRWPARSPVEIPLFDLPAVSQDDLRLWLSTHAPHIDPDGARAAAYLVGYAIAEKIARAKLAGRWPPVAGYRDK